jgi:hypothetical protein
MKEINGQIDMLDFQYVYRLRKEEPVLATPCPRKKGRIHPQTTRFLWRNGQMTDVVHIKPIYYEAYDGKWYPMSDVAYGFGNRWIQLKEDAMDKMTPRYLQWLMKRMELLKGNISIPFPYVGVQPRQMLFNVVTTVFPDPDPETTTVDGRSGKSNSGDWPTTRNATIGQDADTVNDLTAGAGFETPNYRIFRVFALFNTAPIPDADTIDSAVISFKFKGAAPNGDSDPGYVVSSSPATNTDIITEDYDQVGSVSFGTSPFAAADAYIDTTLNADGLVNITKTGVSKFGVRGDFDFNNSTPTLGLSGWNAYMAETADTVSDPKLAVTHSVVVAADNRSPSGGAAYGNPAFY